MTEFIYSLLKKYYGYDSFRGQQEEVIRSILQGDDVIAIMPTGAGKSICYQLPAVAMNGICLVVSPLISLMKDQVTTLNQIGIRAAYLNTSLSYRQYQQALQNAKQGMYKIIYVAPERLMTESFLDFVLHTEISLIAIDEAHCISQWGHDFRPSYTKIHQFIQMFDQKPIISAFTATATKLVQDDMIAQLRLKNPKCYLSSFDRSNLYFAVKTPSDRDAFIVEYLKNHPDQSGIIYCSTRKQVDQLASYLIDRDFSATSYHAGMSDHERFTNQDDFIFDRTSIMVATNAFGMGIDKSNVSFVIHYNMPMNLEAYYQEAGRAGRDGTPADCILLYQKRDVRMNQFLIEKSLEKKQIADPEQATLSLQREQEKLKNMTFYCTTSGCLRKFILAYFGERLGKSCNNCSGCLHVESEELSSELQYILMAIYRLHERYGFSMLHDLLSGEENPKMLQKGYECLPEFGVLSHVNFEIMKDHFTWLTDQEYIYKSATGYPAYKLTPKARSIVSGKLKTRILIENNATDPDSQPFITDLRLLDQLKALRRKLADKQSIPAFVIFTDATLTEMAARKPVTHQQLSVVRGIGQVKLEKYGDIFISEIQNYLQVHS